MWSCEVFMEVFCDNRELFMVVFEVFVYDFFIVWCFMVMDKWFGGVGEVKDLDDLVVYGK